MSSRVPLNSGFIASVQEILVMLRATEGRLPHEVGAFIALQSCEAVLDRPRRIDPSVVHVTAEGEVVLDGAPDAAPSEASASVVDLLASLMVAARNEVPPAFVRIIERKTPTELPRLRDEIEAGLLPLNRSASRRILSRQVRDLLRGDHNPAPKLSSREADASLDAWLGVVRHEIPLADDPVEKARAFIEAPDPLLEGIEEEGSRGGAWLFGILLGVVLAAGGVAAYVGLMR